MHYTYLFVNLDVSCTISVQAQHMSLQTINFIICLLHWVDTDKEALLLSKAGIVLPIVVVLLLCQLLNQAHAGHSQPLADARPVS